MSPTFSEIIYAGQYIIRHTGAMTITPSIITVEIRTHSLQGFTCYIKQLSLNCFSESGYMYF